MARPKKSIQTTGSLTTESSVKSITTSDTKTIQHQTHGAFTPINGPITSVSQLTNGGKSIAKGSVESFGTIEEYRNYLKTLSLGELHTHAIQARIVPIDDRERLIKRLEQSWTGVAARFVNRSQITIPAGKSFSAEQIAAQNEIRNKLLKR